MFGGAFAVRKKVSRAAAALHSRRRGRRGLHAATVSGDFGGRMTRAGNSLWSDDVVGCCHEGRTIGARLYVLYWTVSDCLSV